jgi:hypothetical protein
MKKILLAMLLVLVGCQQQEVSQDFVQLNQFSSIVEIESEFVGKVQLNDNMSIRLLMLKHCPDAIADSDSALAIQAANFAKTKGLDIQEIGDYRVDEEGKTQKVAWGQILDLDGLKRFVSEQSKVNAKPGDTLVVFTIGHGGKDGGLMRLGQREGVMKMLAEVAEENDQEIFWWQLSCYAASHLPPISSLTERQQELFAMSASSIASEESYFGTEGKQMKEVFGAMAEKSIELDANKDDVVTAGELGAFMTKKYGAKRGGLIYARNSDEPIFGLAAGLANQIPIVDRNNPQGKYPRNYIPVPKY